MKPSHLFLVRSNCKPIIKYTIIPWVRSHQKPSGFSLSPSSFRAIIRNSEWFLRAIIRNSEWFLRAIIQKLRVVSPGNNQKLRVVSLGNYQNLGVILQISLRALTEKPSGFFSDFSPKFDIHLVTSSSTNQ